MVARAKLQKAADPADPDTLALTLRGLDEAGLERVLSGIRAQWQALQPPTEKGAEALKEKLKSLSDDVHALHRAADPGPERVALQQVRASLSAAIAPLAVFETASERPRYILFADDPSIQTDRTNWLAFEANDDLMTLKGQPYWDANVAPFEKALWPTPTGDVLNLQARHPVTGQYQRCLIYQGGA